MDDVLFAVGRVVRDRLLEEVRCAKELNDSLASPTGAGPADAHVAAAHFYMAIALLLVMSWLFKFNDNTMNLITGPICSVCATFSSWEVY